MFQKINICFETPKKHEQSQAKKKRPPSIGERLN